MEVARESADVGDSRDVERRARDGGASDARARDWRGAVMKTLRDRRARETNGNARDGGAISARSTSRA